MAKLEINLKELDKLADDLTKATDETQANVAKSVASFAYLIDRETKELISKGPARTGRTYKRRTVTHKASAAGEPPKKDTGMLIASIRPSFYGMFSAEIGSLDAVAKYGGWLERGTAKMAPRPWLAPTLEKNKAQLASFLESAIKDGGLG